MARVLRGIDCVVARNGIEFGLHGFEHDDGVTNTMTSTGDVALFDRDLDDRLVVSKALGTQRAGTARGWRLARFKAAPQLISIVSDTGLLLAT